eukprot:730249-Amphidinium_carterae.1
MDVLPFRAHLPVDAQLSVTDNSRWGNFRIIFLVCMLVACGPVVVDAANRPAIDRLHADAIDGL